MRYGIVLLLTFLILKVTDTVAWPWWAVFLPLMIDAPLFILTGFLTAVVTVKKAGQVDPAVGAPLPGSHP